MELDYISIGNRIAELRKNAGLNQEKLAEMLSVSITHLSRVENGKEGFSKEMLLDMCVAFGASSDYILMGVDSVAEIDRERPYLVAVKNKKTAEVLSQFAEIVEKQLFD